MEEKGVALGLLDLPAELRSLIFSFINTSGLYPHCFLICKALLRAVEDEVAWQTRCVVDLNVTERFDCSVSWRETYQEETKRGWDAYVLSLDERQALRAEKMKDESYSLSTPSSALHTLATRYDVTQALILDNNIATWKPTKYAWMSIRGYRKYTKGRHSIDFKILSDCSSLTCVGVVHQEWEPRLFSYYRSGVKFPTGYWSPGNFWDISGTGRTHEYPNAARWVKGDVVGVMMDFNERWIRFYVNDKLQCIQIMPEEVTALWAGATLYDPGASIQLCNRVPNYDL